jgi:DDE superfamily endonuclease
MPMPTFPLARLGHFRTELYACFARRADALFELGDALLCAPAVTSVAHLSLEPSHRRGWGSAYDALASGRINIDRLRDLLVATLPDTDPLVFAVDVTTWPRCDAECSPARGYYYHPSRHSAGQPIIAGWAWQWIAQLGFDRDSWTAPVDAQRLHPLDDTDQTAAAQIRALLARLPAGEPVPWSVFDGGYDSAQLTLDLAEVPVAVLVRLRSDRCFYADPPPRLSGATGRPRRHGAKFAFADPATWPAPNVTLHTSDDQYGTVTVQAWAGLHPKQQRHPGHGSRGPRPIVRDTIIRVQGERVPARTRPPKVLWLWWAGPWTWTWPGAGTSAGSTWNTPSASPNRPSGGPPRARARPSRPTAGPGWCWLPTPSAPGPRDRLRPTAAVRAARPQPRLLAALGSPATAPKPAGRSPGRPKGSRSGPATRYPAIKKPATKPRKKVTSTAKAA